MHITEFINQLNDMEINMNNKPKWKDAPEWAKWLAQDYRGAWVWFKYKPLPKLRSGMWLTTGAARGTGVNTGKNEQWNTTLEQRPEPCYEELKAQLDEAHKPQLLSNAEEFTQIPTSLYKDLERLGIIDSHNVRSHNVGESNYAQKLIQPWVIWNDYPELTGWDTDIIKRVLRIKDGESDLQKYKKIIHNCQERIRQIEVQQQQE